MGAINDAGEFCGYASTFESVDLGGDVVEKGAYKKTLIESGGRFPILDHHDPTRQIGWNVEAHEDERGLFVRGLLDLNVAAARERHSLMRMAQTVGGRTGLSIGFRAIKEGRGRKHPEIRRLKEVQLLEYSVVTFPMNRQANVVSVKTKKEMTGRFLKNAAGMGPRQTRAAVDSLKSLLAGKNEPGRPHSVAKGADCSEEEKVRRSLRRLLSAVQKT